LLKGEKMKFYKIDNEIKEGVLTGPLNPSLGFYEAGGILFHQKDILGAFAYGNFLHEVIPLGKIIENDGYLKSFKSDKVELKFIGEATPQLVYKLLEEGANPFAGNHYILKWAAKNGDLELVKHLISIGCDIHADGDGPLWIACWHGHLEIVKYLVEHGADIHALHEYPLGCAAKNGHVEIVKYLIKQGADINNDIHGYALKWAKYNNHWEIVELLNKGEKI
jgi:ankyrin repeat protein